MTDILTTVIGTLLKISYLFPFINYYLIANREKKFIYSRSQKAIIIGIILSIINITFLFVTGLMSYNGIMINNQDTMLLTQTIANIIMAISYLMLLLGMYELYNKEVTRQDLHNTIVLTLALSTTIIIASKDFLFRLSVFTYVIGMYFLIRSLLITGFILKSYQKNYYLIIIGAIILILDPVMYVNALNKLLMPLDINAFYYYKQIGYLMGASAMLLISIPNIKFLLKLAKKEILSYESSDTLVENTIKRLINETQTIYGSTTLSILNTTCLKYLQETGIKTDCSEGSLKNLNYKEQKEFFKTLIKEYINTFSEDLLENMTKNIKDTENEALLEECMPNHELTTQSIKPKIKKTHK